MKFQKGHKYAKGGKREGAGRKDGELIREIKTLARAYDVESLERLAYWMRSDNAKASVSASMALLDRAHGKPAQAVELGGKDGQEIILKMVMYGNPASA